IVARRSFPTEDVRGLVAALQEVAREAGGEPEAVGVAAPGPMDMRRGILRALPNLPRWREVDLRGEIGRALGRPVYLANDATCAAIGELEFGHRATDFVYLTWSTGIGGGIVAGGRVVWGATGQAGEVGHLVLRPEGPPCACGKRGCLEALAGGASLARRGSELLGEELSARDVVERARGGDPRASALVAEACRALGQGIALLWEVLEPELVVLGGGLTGSWAYLGPRVVEAAQAMARERVRIELTPLGDDAGLLGASALPRHIPAAWRPG
ncbi:MAG: ROK family protein, partial [Candidatus Bipolaricaulota bacterium]|nr:ROK family protein [Candidatus Bipolaricaulota bacterium]